MDGGDRSSGAELDLGGSDSDRESDNNEVVAMYDYWLLTMTQKLESKYPLDDVCVAEWLLATLHWN